MNWEEQFRLVRVMVLAVFSPIVLCGLLVASKIFPVKMEVVQDQEMMFIFFLAIAIFSIPETVFMGNLMLKKTLLESKFRSESEREKKFHSVLGQIRVGALVMAASGSACAFYGVIFYFLSGDILRSCALILLGVPSFWWTVKKLNETRRILETFSLEN
jgi:hypothetical protein